LTTNQLTGTIPSTVGQLSSLQFLCVGAEATIGDVFAFVLTFHPFCRYLNANRLTGTIPSTVGQISSLQVL
jgi:hypothetical protein